MVKILSIDTMYPSHPITIANVLIVSSGDILRNAMNAQNATDTMKSLNITNPAYIPKTPKTYFVNGFPSDIAGDKIIPVHVVRQSATKYPPIKNKIALFF
jgi:hypothetical protein